MEHIVRGPAYVLGDDIDTDQIIPAEHLVYDPSKPAERAMYGRFSLSGVPPAQAGLPDGGKPFVPEGAAGTEYRVLIGGKNFGCGSSREHAPLSLAEAGAKVVVAEFYARIFFRNCINGGYLVPAECQQRLVGEVRTGDDVEVDFDASVLRNHTTGKSYALNPLGDVLPIIEAGDVFEYARAAGMLKS